MNCRSCHAALPFGAAACPACGLPIGPDSPPPTAGQSSAEAAALDVSPSAAGQGSAAAESPVGPASETGQDSVAPETAAAGGQGLAAAAGAPRAELPPAPPPGWSAPAAETAPWESPPPWSAPWGPAAPPLPGAATASSAGFPAEPSWQAGQRQGPSFPAVQPYPGSGQLQASPYSAQSQPYPGQLQPGLVPSQPYPGQPQRLGPGQSQAQPGQFQAYGNQPYAGPWQPPPAAAGQANPFATALNQAAAARKKKRVKVVRRVAVALGLVLVLVFGSVVYVNVDRAGRYSDAVSLMRQTDYQAALDLFVGLGDYEDAPVRADACRDYLAYEAAEVLYQAGDYEAAKQAFEALGDFKDASARALDCQDQLDFQAGQAAYEAGDLEQAIKLFSMLRLYGFPDSDLWYSKAVYGRAAQRLAAGDNYGAYKDFLEAGDYEDAPAQAAACASPFPATGETYHNASYSAWLPEVNFVGSGNAFLVRLYDGTTLVSEVAVNPYEKTTIRLRAGSYTVKLASGPLWFGGDVKFGDEGFYFIVSFSDSGTVLPLDSGISYTWSMPESAVPSAGEWIDREHF